MRKVKIINNRLIGFSRKSDIQKAERVRRLIDEVINDKNFRNQVLKAEFQDRRFIDESGNTTEISDNNIILKKLISGKEQYTGENKDYEWDLRVTLYRSITSEIGHRSRETIFTKKRKYRNLSDRFIASHWIHEYLHVIGFTHDHERTRRRPYSIPYLIGTLASNTLESKEFDFLS